MFVAGLAIVLAPGLWFDAPYSWDFFNHVARLSVLSAQPDNPVLRFYEVHWALIPNLGMDALFYIVSGLLSPEIFMRAIWCASIVSIAAAVWFLNVTLHGRPQITLLFVPLLSYNLVITAGLFNFALGMALGLVTIALWIRLRGSPLGLRLFLFNAIAVLLFFSHLVAVAAVLLVVVWIEMFPRLALPGRAAIGKGAVVPAFFAVGLALVAFAVPLEGRLIATSFKLGTVLAPFLSTIIPADLTAILAFGAGWLILSRWSGIAIAPKMQAALLLLALLVVVVPTSFGPGALIDSRLAVFGAMLLIGAASASPPDLARSAFIVVAGLGTALRVVLVLGVWSGYEADVRQFRETLKAIPAGSVVLVTRRDDTDCKAANPTAYQHMAALVVQDRSSFSNILFTGRGMHPVQVRPQKEHLVELWQALSPAELKDVKALSAANAAGAPASPSYEYLIAFHWGCGGGSPEVPNLTPVADGRVAALYRIGPASSQ